MRNDGGTPALLERPRRARARATMKATAAFIPTVSIVIPGCSRANTGNTASQKPCPTTSTPETSSVTCLSSASPAVFSERFRFAQPLVARGPER
jgi:hypothetical protein